MQVTDYTHIASAKPIYPDMMTENAEQELIKLFNTIREKKNELATLRIQATFLDQELESLTAKYQKLSKMFHIEYSTKEIQKIHKEYGLGILNKDNARNK